MAENQQPDVTRSALMFLGKQVAVWVAVTAFFAGMVLMVVFGDNAEHKSSLAATIVTTPLFIVQITILAAIALSLIHI